MKKENPKRQVDNYFDYYSEISSSLTNKIVSGISAFGLYFCLLGLSWLIPFPHLHFLGQYNSYFNWASFVIAFSIYYYSKLSPLLSYLMLFLTLIFTYIITILENHFNNKMLLGESFLLVLLTCFILRFITYKTSGKNSTLKMELLFVLIGPIWILHFVLKRLKIKY